MRASRGSKGGATYQATGTYSYKFGDRSFRSTQLSFDIGGSDNIGDWQHEMGGFLDEAKRTGKTIPVYVNPDNPAEAVVDRDVRWAMVLFLGVFGLLFGGAGFFMLAFAVYTLFSRDKGTAKGRKGGKSAVLEHVAQRNRAAVAASGSSAKQAGPVESGAHQGLIGLWIFALIWNLIAFPMALLVVPDLVRGGQWVGLLVLLFPLVGALLLWGCISQSIGQLHRGKATLALNDPAPRMGERFSGNVTYSRGRTPGQDFTVRLAAVSSGRDDGQSSIPRWWADVSARSVADPRGRLRVPFQFDIPARVKGLGDAPALPEALTWQVVATPKKGGMSAQDSFALEVLPPLAAPEELASLQPTAEELRNDAAIARLFGAQAAANLTPEQRAAFAQLPPDAQAMVGKVVSSVGTIRKVAIGIAVLVFVGMLAAILS